MSDFKKNPNPATDDQSPAPVLGATFSIAPEVDTATDQQEDDRETSRQAAPYWHPAWEKVQDEFEEKIAAYGDPGNALAYKDLPAEEFKLRMLTEATVRGELKTIMENVKSAVEQSEQPKPSKQQSGGQ
jgi:hypothetical protein